MEELNPLLSFMIVLLGLTASGYVIYLGSNLLDKNSSDPSGQEFNAEGDGSSLSITVKSSGGVLLVVTGLCGVISVLYMYWMYALPLLILGGGAAGYSNRKHMDR